MAAKKSSTKKTATKKPEAVPHEEPNHAEEMIERLRKSDHALAQYRDGLIAQLARFNHGLERIATAYERFVDEQVKTHQQTREHAEAVRKSAELIEKRQLENIERTDRLMANLSEHLLAKHHAVTPTSEEPAREVAKAEHPTQIVVPSTNGKETRSDAMPPSLNSPTEVFTVDKVPAPSI